MLITGGGNVLASFPGQFFSLLGGRQFSHGGHVPPIPPSSHTDLHPSPWSPGWSIGSIWPGKLVDVNNQGTVANKPWDVCELIGTTAIDGTEANRHRDNRGIEQLGHMENQGYLDK